MTTFQLYRGDAAQVLRGMAANSVDSVVCDPPYGISFMNKHWDYDIPSVETWREVFRVLKPGGHVLSFAGTRTQHRMAAAIEDAGFEIQDMIAWVYATGMPKHQSRLKPALEPITVARKPAPKATLLNIDACRIAVKDEVINVPQSDPTKRSGVVGSNLGISNSDTEKFQAAQRASVEKTMTLGRYPANLIHDGSDDVVALFPDSDGAGKSLPRVKITGYGDGAVGKGKSEYFGGERIPFESGSGSAARFFYCTKASKKDRGEGNNHVTVKPTDLMRYLCRLVTPPNGTVLDPWAGSGSTGKAAILEGFHFVGIDLDSDKDGKSLGYLDIARSRILAVGGVEIGRTEPAPALSRLLSALRGNAVAVESTNGGGENEL